MSKKFKFYIVDELQFQCPLSSLRCHGKTKKGTRCGRKCVIGFELCYQHLRSDKHLRILPSTIPNAGKGLFAMDTTKNDNAIIFRAGDKICDYSGQLINEEQLNERYEDKTASYAVKKKQ